MRFLDYFNEIQKGDFALTDEAIYASIQNGDQLIPLYGGNKEHRVTDRYISISARTKQSIPITVFSGEGIIISLDGSAGSMTYKNGEIFALNHHAGFITLRDTARDSINLEFFSIFMQNYYRGLAVSEGSKTLSLTQVYNEEYSLPQFDVQCRVLELIKSIDSKIKN
jgi:Type I restriction modification DNA specificity domain.